MATANGKNIAIDLNFKFNNKIYLIQRGFDDESKLKKHGPGNVLLYCILKEAANEGVDVYDFLRGDEHYKLRMANQTIQNKHIVLKQSNAAAPSYVQHVKHNMARMLDGINRRFIVEREIFKLHRDQYLLHKAVGKYTNRLIENGKVLLTGNEK
jgi:hypothetical protein